MTNITPNQEYALDVYIDQIPATSQTKAVYRCHIRRFLEWYNLNGDKP